MEEDKLISFLMRKLEATYQYEPSSIRVTSLYRLMSVSSQPVSPLYFPGAGNDACLGFVSALT